MAKLSESNAAATWLSQFDVSDRDCAASLADEIMLVGRDEFAAAMWELLDQAYDRLKAPRQKMALFAERPVRKVFGRVPAFFPNSRHGRAVGPGVAPIIVDPRYQDVGSEGIIAQLITDYCRKHPERALNHPGPDMMRSERIGCLAILTDCVGSGRRINRMLESLGYVRTLQSWRSFGWMSVDVLAFTATEAGRRVVQRSSLSPHVWQRVSCPELSTAFRGKQRKEIERLCHRYPPAHPTALGFNDTAALVAFAHGCPNNAPALLHSRRGGWTPLFPGRSTQSTSEAFALLDEETLTRQRADALLKVRAARVELHGLDWIASMLVLEAIASGQATTEKISARTHLPIEQVSLKLGLVIEAGWATVDKKLTPMGRQEMHTLRRKQKDKPIFSTRPDKFYYPTQLRAP